MSTLSMRPATPADIDILATLNVELLTDEGHAHMANRPALKLQHTNWLETGQWRQHLYEHQGRVIGYVLHAPNPHPLDPAVPEVFLRQFVITADMRGQGLGRAAFDLFLEGCVPEGGRVTLDVLESNTHGRAFWEAVGFRSFFRRMERRRESWPRVLTDGAR